MSNNAIEFAALPNKSYKLKETTINHKVNKLGEKPTTAFIVTLIGGILWLLLGVALAAKMMVLVSGMDPNTNLMFGAYFIIFALLTILGAVMMYSKPSSAHTWGIIIVVLSIIGGVNIITLIGGSMAMRWKPREAPMPPPPPPPP
jgi:hypothetical protein